MAWRRVLGAALLTAGCLHRPLVPSVVDVARERAARELRCSAEQIVVTPRPDIDPRIADVEACGKVARYAVNRVNAFSVREPDPDRAELEAFKAASRASPPR
jgi:hypothetical protein